MCQGDLYPTYIHCAVILNFVLHTTGRIQIHFVAHDIRHVGVQRCERSGQAEGQMSTETLRRVRNTLTQEYFPN